MGHANAFLAGDARMSANKCDVLVVGLGPIGDVLTGLLKVHGLSVIAIDREADIYPLPRAAVFDEEVMRIFQMIGASEAIAPLCRVPDGYQFTSATGEILLRFPMRPGFGAYGWEATYALHQPGVEAALRTRLAELGADVRLSTILKSFLQDGAGVTAEVEGPQGPYTISAQYIVGCDGAWSPVRESFGTSMFDYGFEEPWLVIDSIVEDGDDLPQIPSQICDPAQPTTFLRMSGPRYRWEFMLKPGDDPETFASDENLARLLAPWNVMHRIQIERRAIYRFHGLIAKDWRKGRAIIAGDAAHQMPPFAGQGMCSGIRDAGNLAWKLAAVVRGNASDALLDTYQHEREPHVRGIIERSIEFGQTVCVLDPEFAAARDAAMLAARAAGEQPPMIPYPPLAEGCLMGGPESGELFIQPVVDGERMDYRLGAGPWLITKTAADTVMKQCVIGSDVLGPFSDPLAAWLDERDVEAALIRPDRHIFGIGAALDLIAAWEGMMGMQAELAA
jgi:3-(3-hydroxy-phenyl)propionate hydroxylase